MEYEVVQDTNLNELVRKVNIYIGQNWIPEGGISTGTDEFDRIVYMQAVIKRDLILDLKNELE